MNTALFLETIVHSHSYTRYISVHAHGEESIVSSEIASLLILEMYSTHARFDMTVHDPPTHSACLTLDPTTVYASLQARLTLLSTSHPSDWGHRHTHFTHLLAGYDAGYYSYLSAQVFAKGLFAQFEDDPRCKKTWERYRGDVLIQGAGRDEMENLKAFLGRVPDARLF
jgi:Zn-dependent oligopeptidase